MQDSFVERTWSSSYFAKLSIGDMWFYPLVNQLFHELQVLLIINVSWIICQGRWFEIHWRSELLTLLLVPLDHDMFFFYNTWRCAITFWKQWRQNSMVGSRFATMVDFLFWCHSFLVLAPCAHLHQHGYLFCVKLKIDIFWMLISWCFCVRFLVAASYSYPIPTCLSMMSRHVKNTWERNNLASSKSRWGFSFEPI